MRITDADQVMLMEGRNDKDCDYSKDFWKKNMLLFDKDK